MAILLFAAALTFSSACAQQRAAAARQLLEWHNEQADTSRITTILIDEQRNSDAGKLSRLGRIFEGTPYGAGTLEGSPEVVRINLDSMDCTTFVETVAALALTIRERRSSWQDFAYNLEKLRYRNGTADGYASRLHYVSDWVLDNQSRGLLHEVTSDLGPARHQIKTLDWMSRHREDYPALADSANYARIRSVEAGFSNHRYPYLPGSQASAKYLKQVVHDGDIIIFTTSAKGLDASHMG